MCNLLTALHGALSLRCIRSSRALSPPSWSPSYSPRLLCSQSHPALLQPPYKLHIGRRSWPLHLLHVYPAQGFAAGEMWPLHPLLVYPAQGFAADVPPDLEGQERSGRGEVAAKSAPLVAPPDADMPGIFTTPPRLDLDTWQLLTPKQHLLIPRDWKLLTRSSPKRPCQPRLNYICQFPLMPPTIRSNPSSRLRHPLHSTPSPTAVPSHLALATPRTWRASKAPSVQRKPQ